MRHSLLFAMSSADQRFIVIGGQHTCWVVKELKHKLLAAGQPAPHHLCHVRAAILSVSTPLDVRQAEAGNHQYNQSSVPSLPLSATLQILHTDLQQQQGTEPKHRVLMAIQKKTGARRYETLVCGILCLHTIHSSVCNVWHQSPIYASLSYPVASF